MKKIFFLLAIGILPIFLYSQVTDLTISPDSLYYDNTIYNTMVLTNNSNQPINLLSVQQQCFACVGNWYWKVDSMSVSTPHWVYPGQSVSVVVMAWGGIKSTFSDYKHSTMAIQSSVGLQYCHIFLNSSLISAMDENSQLTLNIYPNPVNDRIFIQNPFSDLLSFELYDLTGQMVYRSKISSNNSAIDLSFLNPGLFFYRIHCQDKTISNGKIIKN